MKVSWALIDPYSSDCFTGTGTIVRSPQCQSTPLKGMAWWRHQMETFFVLLAFCVRNSPVTTPHKDQQRGTLMFSLIYTWTRGWVSNRDAGDLRRHRAHYDVTVMGKIDRYVTTIKHDKPLCVNLLGYRVRCIWTVVIIRFMKRQHSTFVEENVLKYRGPTW